jgi:hypothetical protein
VIWDDVDPDGTSPLHRDEAELVRRPRLQRHLRTERLPTRHIHRQNGTLETRAQSEQYLIAPRPRQRRIAIQDQRTLRAAAARRLTARHRPARRHLAGRSAQMRQRRELDHAAMRQYQRSCRGRHSGLRGNNRQRMHAHREICSDRTHRPAHGRDAKAVATRRPTCRVAGPRHQRSSANRSAC